MPPLLLGPDLVRFEAERGDKLAVLSGLCKAERIGMAHMIEFQEFIVQPRLRIVRIGGHDAQYGGGNRRRVEIPHDGQTLVALLHVKLTVVFIAADRIADALLVEMRLAQRDPLRAELGVRLRERHEVARKDGPPSRADGADDAVGRNVHHAKLDASCNALSVQKIVQHLRVRPATAVDVLPIGFQGFFMCCAVCFDRFGSAQR